ncbi:MAG: hypothetical protein FWC97_10775, partial [Treponema sp.]|nr:hypothetical protein [Treponema sp.]
MKKIFLLFILSSLFLALVFPVFSYDYIDDDTQEEVDTLNDAVFVISSFVFNIDGRTRSSALVYNADLTIGETFPNLEALLSFVQEKTQILYNQRVLEYARIDYAFGEMSPDGKIPVILTINTRDSWNVIALPRPQYSSNTGLD